MNSKQHHPSDSSEQQQAHKEILVLLNKTHNLNLASKKLLIGDTLFQSDGYSDEPPIMCEIYSRIGEMKVAQFNKIGKAGYSFSRRYFFNYLVITLTFNSFNWLVRFFICSFAK